MMVFDIHTHGIGGVDTQTANPEDILRIAEIHGAHGVDAILAALYPAPVDAMRGAMAAVKEAMERQRKKFGVKSSEFGVRNETERGKGAEQSREFGVKSSACPAMREVGNSARTFEVPRTESSERESREPAMILGAYLEGPFLNPLRAGALDGSSFLTPSAYGLERLMDGFEEFVKIVVIAPELPGSLSLIREIADLGIRVSMGHSDASWTEAEAGFHAGATGVTHLFNAMRPWHHREPGLAGFALTDPDLYVEVIADSYHLHESVLRFIFSTKNPERILLVSDSVKATGTDASEAGVRDEHGRLRGGSLTLPESANRLLRLGYSENLIRNATYINQERYITR